MTLFHPSHKVSDFLFNYFCLKGWCVSEKILPSKVLMLPKKETLAGSPFGLASARPVPSRVLGSSDVGGALKGQTRPIADVSLMRHSQRCAAWGPCQSDRHASREVSPEARYPTFQNLSHQSHCLRRSGYVPSSALRLVTCAKKRRGEVRLIYDWQVPVMEISPKRVQAILSASIGIVTPLPHMRRQVTRRFVVYLSAVLIHHH
jgi:hypothetical protein